jgi:hypothetical protein
LWALRRPHAHEGSDIDSEGTFGILRTLAFAFVLRLWIGKKLLILRAIERGDTQFHPDRNRRLNPVK